MTGDLNMGDHKILNLKDPTNDNDAVNKKYFENNIPNEQIVYFDLINLYKNDQLLPLQTLTLHVLGQRKMYILKKDGLSTDPSLHAFINLEFKFVLRNTFFESFLSLNNFTILLYYLKPSPVAIFDIVDVSFNMNEFTLINSGSFDNTIYLFIKNDLQIKGIYSQLQDLKISFKLRYFGPKRYHDLELFRLTPFITNKKN